jgi:hypothetical protein
MLALSIDIGITNLAITIVINDNIVDFDLYDISKSSKPVTRCIELSRILDNIIEDKDVELIIIERQVPQNIVAMEIMYALIGLSLKYTKNIVIYDPKLKFSTLNLPYNTKNKAHKTLSIKTALEYLLSINHPKLTHFQSFIKQDDISDSILQYIAYKLKT